MLQNVADDDMFQYLAAKAGQRNWVVVRRVITLSFLEYFWHIGGFQSTDTVPVHRDLLKMMVNIGDKSPEHSFNNLAGTMSGPEALRGSLFCSSFLTPLSVTVICSMSG